MNVSIAKTSLFKFLGNWWFSLFLIYPIWIITDQFWLTLARNILMAINYNYPPILGFLFFIINTITLLIHEAGHTIFGVFGWNFLAILGGTLMQLLIPFSILITAWWKHQIIVAQTMWFWLGFSWMDTAAYCADAKFQNLPLIGNLPKSAHDFSNLLSMTGLLDQYRFIAWIFFSVGIICFLIALIWPAVMQKKARTVDLRDQLERAGLDT